MDVDRIVKFIEKIDDTPTVYVFNNKTKEIMDEVIEALKNKGYNFFDPATAFTILPEDYFIPVTEVGLHGEEGLVVNDLLVDEDRKIHYIYKAKIKRMLKDCINEKTVLLVSYNDTYLNNKVLYEITRSWLKDGYRYNEIYNPAMVRGIVFAEENERLNDFVRYGFKVMEENRD